MLYYRRVFAVRQLFEQHRQGYGPLNLRRALAPNLAPGATFTCVTTTWRSYAMALYNNEQHIAICCLIFDNALHLHQELCALLGDSIESSRLTDLLNNATRHNANSPRQSPQFQEPVRRLHSSRYSSHSLVPNISLPPQKDTPITNLALQVDLGPRPLPLLLLRTIRQTRDLDRVRIKNLVGKSMTFSIPSSLSEIVEKDHEL